MSSEFPYKFDPVKLNEMEQFLNRLLHIVQENNLYLSSDMVYSELKHYGLKQNDKVNGRLGNVKFLFDRWINNFKNRKNISVFNSENWEYWCQFVNNCYSDEYIKLYIPIDKDHIEEGVNQLFSFNAKNNIRHQSKVGKEIRSDNVIVRLEKGDMKSLKLIIDYISSNPYIKNGLNKVNPFIPCINGIGVMNETGISYNDEISKVIAHYINEHRNDRKIDLNNFIVEAKKGMYLDEVIHVFDNACGKNKQNVINNGTLQVLNNDQKYVLLNNTINATLIKYGPKQVEAALYYSITQNNYKYFTNGNTNLRNNLMKYIKPNEILELIRNTMMNVQQKKYSSTEEMIHEYVNLFYGSLSIQKFDEMCEVTRENHGDDFLVKSIHGYIRTGSETCFSRYRKNSEDKYNYRGNVKYVIPQEVVDIMKKSLEVKGIPTNDLDYVSLLKKYVSTLRKYNEIEEDLNNSMLR